MKEILDKRAEISSTWQFVVVCILILLGLSLVYILKDKIFYLIWTIKTKYIERQIRKHSVLLKENSDPKKVPKLDSLLLRLFWIYETKISRPVSLVRLFPESESVIRGELDEYELGVKNILTRYYVMHQNIVIYNDGNIKLTELIKRINVGG